MKKRATYLRVLSVCVTAGAAVLAQAAGAQQSPVTDEQSKRPNIVLLVGDDMGLGDTGRTMGGAHEIMIRYDFRYVIDVMNPRYF